MVDINDELKWEAKMVDEGVDKYLAITDAIRFNKYDQFNPMNDESATSYGISMLKEYVMPFEEYVAAFVEDAYNRRGPTDISAQYIARCDTREVAYITAKCVIDTIGVIANQTELAYRIAGKLQDQMRMKRFDEDYPRYFKRLCEDMQMRGVKNYRHKRKVLTHCHDKAVANAKEEGKDAVEWTPWPKPDRLQIGANLIDLFIHSTGLIERITSRNGGKTSYQIVATDYAQEFIRANIDAFKYMSPEYMPTLIQPKEWTNPWNGGYYSEEMRRRRPMVKMRGHVRKAHSELLKSSKMPIIYEAINAAQNTPWRVNQFVLEQARNELDAHGIGCPPGMNVSAPASPYPMPERGALNDVQYQCMIDALRANMTDEEQKEMAVWRGQMRDWHHKKISNTGKMIGLHNCYKVAKQMSTKERFFYVHSLDSRSRLYPGGSYLNPQGTDLAKGMLEFADSTRLGRWGFWHLMVHAAGVFGVDKVSIEERVEWIQNHRQRIMDTWADPAQTREFWGAADKPYLFLAVCRELAEIWMFNGEQMLTIVNKEAFEWYGQNYESRIPCAQDGSCNGIQHFSAMLLDLVGAAAVNMRASKPGDRPSDIYGVTAQRVVSMLNEGLDLGLVLDGKEQKAMLPEEAQLIRTWLDVLEVDRKVCKRSTMIIPYGGQRSSCLEDIRQVLDKKLDKLERSGKPLDWDHNKRYKAAWILHLYVWKALDEVVVAARTAMKFLSQLATVQNRTGCALTWTTPVGFPAFQDYKDMRAVEVKTKINGRMRLKYMEPTDKLNEAKMRNAFPPNFVHSMDASHLFMTVAASLDHGITNFGLVHDSYAVPAGDCEVFHKVIREQFIELYRVDRLQELVDEQILNNPSAAEDYPEPPARGEFNIEEVRDAIYFFL